MNEEEKKEPISNQKEALAKKGVIWFCIMQLLLILIFFYFCFFAHEEMIYKLVWLVPLSFGISIGVFSSSRYTNNIINISAWMLIGIISIGAILLLVFWWLFPIIIFSILGLIVGYFVRKSNIITLQ